MTRAVAAARLYVVNKWMLIWIPLIVLGAMVALTVILQVIVTAAGGSDQVAFNGAFQAVFWCLLGVAVAASTQMFPFAFAMSLTRRDFWLGTLIAALAVAVGYGLLYGVLAWVETITDGYWIGAHSFDLMGFADGWVGESAWLYGGIILMFFVLGFTASMVWKRFAGKGLVITGLAMMIVILALVAWAGVTNAWPTIGAWIVVQTPVSIGAYAVAASAVMAGISYLLIRHAEP